MKLFRLTYYRDYTDLSKNGTARGCPCAGKSILHGERWVKGTKGSVRYRNGCPACDGLVDVAGKAPCGVATWVAIVKQLGCSEEPGSICVCRWIGRAEANGCDLPLGAQEGNGGRGLIV
jgi:hypothetical protein